MVYGACACGCEEECVTIIICTLEYLESGDLLEVSWVAKADGEGAFHEFTGLGGHPF